MRWGFAAGCKTGLTTEKKWKTSLRVPVPARCKYLTGNPASVFDLKPMGASLLRSEADGTVGFTLQKWGAAWFQLLLQSTLFRPFSNNVTSFASRTKHQCRGENSKQTYKRTKTRWSTLEQIMRFSSATLFFWLYRKSLGSSGLCCFRSVLQLLLKSDAAL